MYKQVNKLPLLVTPYEIENKNEDVSSVLTHLLFASADASSLSSAYNESKYIEETL